MKNFFSQLWQLLRLMHIPKVAIEQKHGILSPPYWISSSIIIVKRYLQNLGDLYWIYASCRIQNWSGEDLKWFWQTRMSYHLELASERKKNVPMDTFYHLRGPIPHNVSTYRESIFLLLVSSTICSSMLPEMTTWVWDCYWHRVIQIFSVLKDNFPQHKVHLTDSSMNIRNTGFLLTDLKLFCRKYRLGLKNYNVKPLVRFWETPRNISTDSYFQIMQLNLKRFLEMSFFEPFGQSTKK